MTQPEALRLADALEHDAATQKIYHRPLVEASAAELRRLHEVNAELLAALKLGYTDTMDYIQRNHLCGSENNRWLVLARAAIAKAEEAK